METRHLCELTSHNMWCYGGNHGWQPQLWSPLSTWSQCSFSFCKFLINTPDTSWDLICLNMSPPFLCEWHFPFIAFRFYHSHCSLLSLVFQESGWCQSQGEVGLQQHVLGAPQKPRLHQHGVYSEPVVAHGPTRLSDRNHRQERLLPMHHEVFKRNMLMINIRVHGLQSWGMARRPATLSRFLWHRRAVTHPWKHHVGSPSLCLSKLGCQGNNRTTPM